jgi:hypothetical protein
LLKKNSTNVDYFGIRRETSQLFIQFSNGTCFMYANVPTEVLEEAKNAPSIGKFFHQSIKWQYEDEAVGSNLIADAPEGDVDVLGIGIVDDEDDDLFLDDFNL